MLSNLSGVIQFDNLVEQQFTCIKKFEVKFFNAIKSQTFENKPTQYFYYNFLNFNFF